LVFSQPVLLSLVRAGMSRDEAYRVVQRSAMRAWDEGLEFRSLIDADPDAQGIDLDDAFDLERSLANLDVVFARLDEISVGSV
jgi:adenylosuccinate lyase